MIKVHYGCKEWQDEREFENEALTQEFIEKVERGKVGLGLYPADFALIAEGEIDGKDNS